MSSLVFSVQDVADRYGVVQHTVLTWIRAGELIALDVSRNRGARPRWRITSDAIVAFETARTHRSDPPRKRRHKRAPGVIRFY